MIDWTKLKISKKEEIVHKRYSEGQSELLYVITQNINEFKFNLYKVNSDGTITKLKTQNNPIFLDTHGVEI